MYLNIQMYLIYTMEHVENIGFIAMSLSILSFFPVILNIYKTKKTNNFPYKSIFLALFAHLFWLIYGIYKKAYANIFAGLSFLTMYFVMLYIKIYYN